MEEIAAQAGVSVRSVQRHITLLTLRDLIETEETPGSETIFRLLPLPAWLVEGRRTVLAEDQGQGTPDRRRSSIYPDLPMLTGGRGGVPLARGTGVSDLAVPDGGPESADVPGAGRDGEISCLTPFLMGFILSRRHG